MGGRRLGVDRDLLGAAGAAHVVHARVVRDPVQPRLEPGGPVQGADAAQGGEEYLLHDVLSARVVAEDAAGIACDGRAVAAEKHGERLGVPGLCPLDQLLVAGLDRD